MTCRAISGLVFLCCLLLPRVNAQRPNPVDPRNRYHRILAVVPMVGKGTHADPRRPLYAPWPPGKGDKTGIIAWSHQVSDNGQFALVEFVARTPWAFQPLRADKSGAVQLFDKGRSKKEDIEKEFKRHKKDFDIEKFGAVLP